MHEEAHQDRTAGKFCQVKSGSIRNRAEAPEGFQLFVVQAESGCTAINRKHKKVKCLSMEASPRAGNGARSERISRHRPGKIYRERVFFHMLGLLG